MLPRVTEGVRLAAPLVLAGGPDSREILRVTLGADAVHTVTAYRREKKTEKIDKPPMP